MREVGCAQMKQLEMALGLQQVEHGRGAVRPIDHEDGVMRVLPPAARGRAPMWPKRPNRPRWRGGCGVFPWAAARYAAAVPAERLPYVPRRSCLCARKGRAQRRGRHPDHAVGLPARLHQHLRAGSRAARAPTRIGRVRGSQRNDYTAGVICEKVARYAERIHHPDRLMKPLRRVGPKGCKQFARDLVEATRSTSSPSSSSPRRASTAARRSGRITTPARWGWCSATASTACATR